MANTETLLRLIKQVVLYAGDFRWAEVEELGLTQDASCPTVEEGKKELNEALSELWKAISTEPEPKELAIQDEE